MAHILIIDDDPDFCYALDRTVSRLGHTTVQCDSLSQCKKIMLDEEIDAVFLDVMLPDGNGLTLMPEFKDHKSQPEIIIITGAGDSEGAELAISNGAWDYINKGTSVKKITLTLERALQYRTERQQANQNVVKVALKREDIIGSSSSISTCFDQVAQCAGNDVNVIITGETGTGKELFARAIHDNSPRAEAPFVVVDCASLSESLAESILFGYKKGAFTGADRNERGLILEADSGTLFLDEIGELPLSMQKTFLRILQERTVRPVGGREEIKCNFRLVAATNRDLEDMVEANQFRRDLYYRLQSFNVHLPPLRMRLEDVDAIATFHINRICDRIGIERKTISTSCFESLKAYNWSGNVRELVNCLEQTVVSAGPEQTLYPVHLPLKIRVQTTQANLSTPDAIPVAAAPQAVRTADAFHPQTLQQYRESVYVQAEENYLRGLLTYCKGELPEAIRISGLSQSRLYALLKNYGIKPSSFKE